ncbi:MAG: CDGSH iron-sulfur domain-containing protein [Gammaproteobacteria bacterium]|nr:CDGSH iron-sulfur domain-containing protein [Gammaproteobacteria bacterium]
MEKIVGKEVTIHFDGSRCIHSRNCVLSRPDVFVPNVKGEWIHPDAAPADVVMHLGYNCPSGAIRVTRNSDNADTDTPPIVNTVRVRENGPLAIEGELDIAGATGSVRATLCRCGQSKNKPYCDGSHHAAGFEASGEPSVQEFQTLESRDGVVKVKPLPNGPLNIEGNLEVVSGTGATTNKVTKTFLCRCGHSKNKPYCDGSHAKVGFEAP